MVLSRALSALVLATVVVVTSIVEYYRSHPKREKCGNDNYEQRGDSDMNEDTSAESDSSRNISEITKSGASDQEFEEMGSKCCGAKKMSKVEPNMEDLPQDMRSSRTGSINSQNGGKGASGDAVEVIELDEFAGVKKRSEYSINDTAEIDESCENDPLLGTTEAGMLHKANGETTTGSDDELVPLIDGNDDSSISAAAAENASVVAEALITRDACHLGPAHDQNVEKADGESTRSSARATANDAPNTEEAEGRIESEQSNFADSKIETDSLSHPKETEQSGKEGHSESYTERDNFQPSFTSENEHSMASQEKNTHDATTECHNKNIKYQNGHSQDTATIPPVSPNNHAIADSGQSPETQDGETGPASASPREGAMNNAGGDNFINDICGASRETLSDDLSAKIHEGAVVDHASGSMSLEEQQKHEDVCANESENATKSVNEKVPKEDERMENWQNEDNGTELRIMNDACEELGQQNEENCSGKQGSFCDDIKTSSDDVATNGVEKSDSPDKEIEKSEENFGSISDIEVKRESPNIIVSDVTSEQQVNDLEKQIDFENVIDSDVLEENGSTELTENVEMETSDNTMVDEHTQENPPANQYMSEQSHADDGKDGEGDSAHVAESMTLVDDVVPSVNEDDNCQDDDSRDVEGTDTAEKLRVEQCVEDTPTITLDRSEVADDKPSDKIIPEIQIEGDAQNVKTEDRQTEINKENYTVQSMSDSEMIETGDSNAEGESVCKEVTGDVMETGKEITSTEGGSHGDDFIDSPADALETKTDYPDDKGKIEDVKTTEEKPELSEKLETETSAVSDSSTDDQTDQHKYLQETENNTETNNVSGVSVGDPSNRESEELAEDHTTLEIENREYTAQIVPEIRISNSEQPLDSTNVENVESQATSKDDQHELIEEFSSESDAQSTPIVESLPTIESYPSPEDKTATEDDNQTVLTIEEAEESATDVNVPPCADTVSAMNVDRPHSVEEAQTTVLDERERISSHEERTEDGGKAENVDGLADADVGDSEPGGQTAMAEVTDDGDSTPALSVTTAAAAAAADDDDQPTLNEVLDNGQTQQTKATSGTDFNESQPTADDVALVADECWSQPTAVSSAGGVDEGEAASNSEAQSFGDESVNLKEDQSRLDENVPPNIEDEGEKEPAVEVTIASDSQPQSLCDISTVDENQPLAFEEASSAEAHEAVVPPITEVATDQAIEDDPTAQITEVYRSDNVPTIEISTVSETEPMDFDEATASDNDAISSTVEVSIKAVDDSESTPDAEKSTADESQHRPVDEELTAATIDDSTTTPSQELSAGDEHQSSVIEASTGSSDEGEAMSNAKMYSADDSHAIVGGEGSTVNEITCQSSEHAQVSTAEADESETMGEAGPSIEESIVNEIINAAVKRVTANGSQIKPPENVSTTAATEDEGEVAPITELSSAGESRSQLCHERSNVEVDEEDSSANLDDNQITTVDHMTTKDEHSKAYGEIEVQPIVEQKNWEATPAVVVSTVDENRPEPTDEMSNSDVDDKRSPAVKGSDSNSDETADESLPLAVSDNVDGDSSVEMNETESTSVDEVEDQESLVNESSEVEDTESALKSLAPGSPASENKISPERGVSNIDENPTDTTDDVPATNANESAPDDDVEKIDKSQDIQVCEVVSATDCYPLSNDDLYGSKSTENRPTPAGDSPATQEYQHSSEGEDGTADARQQDQFDVDSSETALPTVDNTEKRSSQPLATDAEGEFKTGHTMEFQNPIESVCKKGDENKNIDAEKRRSIEIKEDGFVMVVTSADTFDEIDPIRKGDIVKPVRIKNSDHNTQFANDETQRLPETEEKVVPVNTSENSEDKSAESTGEENAGEFKPVTNDEDKITNSDDAEVDVECDGDVRDSSREAPKTVVESLGREHEDPEGESENGKAQKKVTIKLVDQRDRNTKIGDKVHQNPAEGATADDQCMFSEDDHPPVFLDFELVTMDREDEGDTEDDATQKIGPMTVKKQRSRGSEKSRGRETSLFGTSPSGYDSDVEGSSQPEVYDDDTKKRRRKPRKKKESNRDSEDDMPGDRFISPVNVAVETENFAPVKDGIEETEPSKTESNKSMSATGQKEIFERQTTDDKSELKTRISSKRESNIGFTDTHIRKEKNTITTASITQDASVSSKKEEKTTKERKIAGTINISDKATDKSKIEKEKKTPKSPSVSKSDQVHSTKTSKSKNRGLTSDSRKNENAAKRDPANTERAFGKARVDGRKKPTRGTAAAAGSEKPQTVFDSGGQGDARADSHSSDRRGRSNAVRALARLQQGKSPTPTPDVQPKLVAYEMGVPVDNKVTPENNAAAVAGGAKKKKKKKAKSGASTPSATSSGKVENISVGVQVDSFGERKRVEVCDSAVQVSIEDDDLTSEMSEDRATVDSELSATKGSDQKEHSGPYVAEFPYPANSIPKLIGRRGKHIRQIASRTNTVITNRPSDVKEFHTIRVEAEHPKQLWIAMLAIQNSPRRD